MNVLWSPTAEKNIHVIWEYITQDNLDAADRIVNTLRTSAEQLTRFPFLGRSGRSNRTRELVESGTPYIIVYRAIRGRIEVARVLHGKQQWRPKS